MQLSDGLKQHGSKTRVLHTLEILARNILNTSPRRKPESKG
jgi:hypothetical protein